MEAGSIRNKVAESGIITLDMSDWVKAEQIRLIDIKDQLEMELVLREKDFRSWVKTHDWNQYKDTYVGVFCSNTAVIPNWAYMLVTVALTGIAKSVVFGDTPEVKAKIVSENVALLSEDDYLDQRVILKGCGDIPAKSYVELTHHLKKFVKSILFGEPCSTVPVYKKAK